MKVLGKAFKAPLRHARGVSSWSVKCCIEPVITVVNGKSFIPDWLLPMVTVWDVLKMAEFGSTFVGSV